MSIIFATGMACTPLHLHAGETTVCPLNSAKALNQAAQPYNEAIQKAAKRYAVKPALIKAVIAGGSCFDPVKVSPKGAVGLMQLLPATAVRFGALDITDPHANIDAGARYLSYLLKRYQGSIAEVLAAHAADEGWEGSYETIHSLFQDTREPVTRTLGILLKLDNGKKTNRHAKALLKTWEKSAEAYQHALLASPPSPAAKAFATWYKSRLTKVHYPRTPDARSCGGFSAKTLSQKAAPYEAIIKQAAKRHGVNIALIKSVIAAESCYREMVVSPKGASGLMQLMPETAAELGVLDIFDPEENINAGTRYLGWLVRYYGGSVTHAIAAYNAGPGRITLGAPVTIEFTETRGYINTVLTHLTKLESNQKALQYNQLLLAAWNQAELEYQAALRGETLPTIPAETGQPSVILAYLRNEGTAGTPPAVATPLANVHLIPTAPHQDIVRVKRISSAVVFPVEMPALAMQPQALVPATLPDCSALPTTLLAQTQQQGSGRYAAFFYPVQPGETLELIAQKLEANVQDIIRLGKLLPDSLPKAGNLLRVAECFRPPEPPVP
ncbi:MAG: transglycosylase SLT domain-containing protein [Gammaproteobacteria bacterium]|nr:transglycosylase SLT domain-containing protein [Gammaproteobacteria bacterium]